MIKEKQYPQHGVKPTYTISLVLRFLGFTSFGFTIFGLGLLCILNRRLSADYLSSITTLTQLQEKFPGILLCTALIQSVIFSLLLLLILFLWTHAIAGPLWRFRKYLQALKVNQVTDELTFRSTDQLHYLAEGFRKMNHALQARNKKWQNLGRQVDILIEQYEEYRTNKCPQEDLTKIRDQLMKSFEEMKTYSP